MLIRTIYSRRRQKPQFAAKRQFLLVLVWPAKQLTGPCLESGYSKRHLCYRNGKKPIAQEVTILFLAEIPLFFPSLFTLPL